MPHSLELGTAIEFEENPSLPGLYSLHSYQDFNPQIVSQNCVDW